MSRRNDFILGIHPASQGFGWALFDGPDSLFDWGTADIRNGDTVKVLLRVAQLFDKYRPPVLVLEEFDGVQSRRRPRLRLLCRAVVARAELRNMRVHRHARENIAAALFPARTRHEIAVTVAARLEALRPHVPQKRKVWEHERLAMSVFCAAACVLSYYAAQSV